MNNFISSFFFNFSNKLPKRFRIVHCLATILLLLQCITSEAQVSMLGSVVQATNTNTIASFTVPAGNNRMLLVTASDAFATNITSVSFGATALIERLERNDGYAVDAIYTISLGSSAVSTSGSIVFGSSNTSTNAAKIITARVFNNVDQTTNLNDTITNQNSIVPSASNLTIESNSGDLVFDIFDTYRNVTGGSAQFAGPGQTITSFTGMVNFGTGGDFGFYSTSTKPGASLVSMSWSTTDHTALLHLAVSIKQAACTNPTVPTITQGTTTSSCSSTTTTLSIGSGSLNSATNWQWYSGSCGGVSVGSGTSITPSASGATTYYVRGEGGCVTPGACASISIPVSLPEIDVQGNSISIADGTTTVSSTNNTDFGNVISGQTLSKTFTIFNNGTSPLTVSSITSSNAKFTIGTLTPASPIAAGASSTFTVLFSPTTAILENSTITINNNDCNEGVYDFVVRGSAIQASTSLSLNGNATSALGSVTFFTATLHRDSAPSGPLSGQTVAFVITLPSGFTQLITAVTNSSGQASVAFTSTMLGVHNVVANFSNLAAGLAPSTSSPITHTVLAQEINIKGNGQDIIAGDITPSLTDHTDFGNVFVGNNIVRTFTIQNTGGSLLTISNIVSNNSTFVVGGFPASIAAGNSATFTVTFTPTVAGIQNASITISNNDVDEGSYSFALQGMAFSHTSIYVDSSATGNNSGTSWIDAFTDFQSALSIASANDAVYVAKGTYKPSVGAGYSRTRTFSLVNAVNFYGGFPSGGGTFASRNFVNNRSVLSGDIGVLNDSTDNCFNVVDANNLTASTKMSGFTIERGVADSNSSFVKYGRSGGMYLGPTGAIRLDSVTFRNNFGKGGSAIYAEAPVNWILNGCSFTNNNNTSAINIGGNASGSMTNCSFSNNQGFNGGAIVQNVLSATFTFTNCTFDHNKATGSGGGGAINAGASTNTFINCSFTNNTATNGPGGALYKFYGNLNSFTNCTFTGNSGGGGFGGGALYSAQGGFSLNGCVLSQNFSIGTSSSTAHGGAIYNNGGATTLSNCLFYGNYTQYGIGGAVYNNTGGTVNATSCTFALNSDPAYNQGGGLNNNSNSNASIMNCIFWNNSTNGNVTNSVSQIGHGSGVLNVSNTIWKGNTAGGTIYNVDPLFVDATNGDFTLQDCSPAIDTGVTNSLSTDILGNPRVDVFPGGLVYDLGAYERQTTPLISEIDVQSNSQNINDGSTATSGSNNTDYGNVTVGQTLSKTFTIFNNGTSPLTVSGITSSNAKFAIGTLTPASPIAAGASSTFTVLFTPTIGSVENSTITINNNDCNEGVYDFALTGTGQSALTSVSVNGNATSALGSVTFFTATLLRVSAPSGPLSGQTVAFTITLPNFSTQVITAVTNALGQASVAFTSTLSGVHGVVASFNNLAAGLAPATSSSFTHTVSAQEINVQGNSVTIVDGDNTPDAADHTDFGNVIIGNNLLRIYTIQNTGLATLNISSITSSNPLFVVSGAPGSITGGSSATFNVTYTPTVTGTATATIIINNNDADEGIYNFDVQGIGVAPCPTLTFTETHTVACTGTTAGSITISNPTGGTSPYTYSINNGVSYSGSASFLNLAQGSYQLKIKDANGCESSAVMISNLDNQAPTLIAPISPTISAIANTCAANYTILDPITDNCPGSSWTYNLTGATVETGSYRADGIDATNISFNKGVTIVTLQGVDAVGLAAVPATFNVTVTDNESPSMTCAGPVTVNNTSGLCTGTATVVSPSVTDNCNTLIIGNALNFDGVDDIGRVAATSVINTATQTKRTVEVYFRVFDKNISSRKQVIWEEGGTNNGLNIYVYNGSLYYGIYSLSAIPAWDGVWLSTPNIQSGQWHIAALVYDGTLTTQRLKAYLDGVLVASADASSLLGTSLAPHPQADAIGALDNNGKFHDGSLTLAAGHYFAGDIDEIRLWTVARTAAELQATTTTQLAGNNTGLAVYYNFDQGIACGNNTSVNFVDDITATNLNATMSNFAINGSSGCTSNWTSGSPALNSVITLTNDFTGTSDASGTYPIGSTNVHWTATDASGNSSTCTQVVTVLAPEIDVKGNNTSIEDGDVTANIADHTDFGNVLAGQTFTRTFTIKNTGTSNLSIPINGMVITGVDASLFTLGSISLPATIAPNDSLNIQVVFSPTTVGVKHATINIASNDCNEVLYDFAIKGGIDCQPLTIVCPGNQSATTAQSVCNKVMNYTSSSTGIPTPTLSYKFTGATSAIGSGDGSGSVFNVGVTHVTIYASNSCSADSCAFDVTISSGTTGASSYSTCDSYQWTNGTTYTTSGQYTHTFPNAQGCDSVHTLNLTIHNSNHISSSVSQFGCYTWTVNNQTYTLSGTYTASFTNQNGCDSIHTLNLTITPGVKLAIKAILDGPFNALTGLMNDSLRVNNLIPGTEPYTASPYSKPAIGGPSGETVTSTVLGVSGNDAIVDWVYLELRDAINPANVIASKRALIQRDGDIVSNTDGTSAVLFETVYNGNYFVTVKHRNHLGIMSANALGLYGCSTTSIDFTSSSPVYTMSSISTAPRKLNGTVYTLWSADATNNKNVKYNGLANDKDKILTAVGVATPNGTINTVYRMEDVNMDGKIRYNNTDNDRLPVINNIGVNNPNNILNQHTPN